MNTDKVHLSERDKLYAHIDSFEYHNFQDQPPCIGLSSNQKDGLSCVANTYVQAILKAGGCPVLIPVTTNIEVLTTALEKLDGLVLTGGGDINPQYNKQEPIPQLQEVDPVRDQYDFTLLRLAANRQMPVFGICRGHQLINLAFGGTLYQDIYAEAGKGILKHTQHMPREYGSHTVYFLPDSKLGELFDTHTLVNSFHHQAVKDIAPGFIESAKAPDGINEALESYPFRQIYSVQWHPESMAAADNGQMLKLFKWIIREAALFRKAKNIHHTYITLDSHCDTPMLFEEGASLGQKSAKGKVNIPRMTEGMVDAACIVAYLEQGARDDLSLSSATLKATRLINEIKHQVNHYPTLAAIAYTPEDVIQLKKEGRKSFFIGIENGYAIGKDITNISRFKEMGVIYITLCHNGNNDLCDSAKGEVEWNGLSPLGREAIHEMNRCGIMIDISHAAESSFYDTITESRFPIIASHSSVRALCDHPRNLNDHQLHTLARHGGVVQLCLYSGFLNQQEPADVADAVKHICYLRNLIGIDHIGIGSDFDGGGGIKRCDGSNELINITKALLSEGFTPDELQKIWGGNFLRIMKKIQSGQQQKK